MFGGKDGWMINGCWSIATLASAVVQAAPSPHTSRPIESNLLRKRVTVWREFDALFMTFPLENMQ
jgi:hypothetical protein